jgi:protein-tyrosine phosphatase
MPFDMRRHVPMQGALNFRDVGGCVTSDGRRVRRGLIFRSDGLTRLTDEDLRTLERLRLRTVVDLRTVQERASEPDRLPACDGLRCVHLPMRDPSLPESRLRLFLRMVWNGPSTDFEAMLQRHFTSFAFDCTQSVGGLLRLLADPANLPAVVHCTAGKDRTGFTMATLLLSLGVPIDDVLEDHLISNELLSGLIPRWVKRLRRASLGRLSEPQIMPLLVARAEHIQLVVQEICDKHGSIQAWMHSDCGVDCETQRRIAEVLLDLPAR